MSKSDQSRLMNQLAATMNLNILKLLLLARFLVASGQLLDNLDARLKQKIGQGLRR